MKNVFFPEDEVTVNDLYFVCYMIERIARRLKQPNKYVANAMGRDEIAKKLSLHYGSKRNFILSYTR